MEIDPILGLLGLSRKAGKLACGLDETEALIETGKARAILIANDLGSVTQRKIQRHEARVPILRLEADRETVGASVGVRGCGVCALSDIGFAAALAKKLAEQNEQNHAAAQRILEKQTRIAARKGIKKKKDPARAAAKKQRETPLQRAHVRRASQNNDHTGVGRADAPKKKTSVRKAGFHPGKPHGRTKPHTN
jgi:ribosomal protein L7Ae-like RNA K-turn-binding protein